MKHLKSFITAAATVIVILIGSAAGAAAANYVVTNTNNAGAGSLRQAILDSNAAAGSDNIVFSPAVFGTPQTIVLATVLTINPAPGDSLTIAGPGADLLTISGNNAVRIFQISSGDTASISGLTLTLARTGAIDNDGTLTVADCVFSSNTSGNGGAIANGVSLTVTRCTFTENTATSSSATGLGGGAIYSSTAGTVTISDSSFTGNMEVGGSGGGGAVKNRGGTMTITNSTFANNTAVDGGGAVANADVMSISGCIFTGNATASASSNGGAIYNVSAGALTITNSAVTGNSTANLGGGIYHQPNATSGTFLSVSDSTIANNTANSDGNTTGDGGGLYLTGTGSVTITRCGIYGNTANAGATGSAGDGGGIDVSTRLNLINSTVSGNTAGRNGGGIQATGTSSAEVTIDSSTIVNNDGIGLVRGSSSNPVYLRNTLLANNRGLDTSGSVISQGYNLIKRVGGAVGGNTTGNIIGVDPKIGPLADNGGVTKTHALLAGSPAIDKGASGGLTIDQRGFERPYDHAAIANASDGADIGALESDLSVPTLVVTNADDSGPGSLRDMLAAANTNGQVDTIVFDAAFFSTPKTIVLASELQISADGSGPSRHVHIKGPGAELVTVSGNNAVRPFFVAPGASAAISGITIRDGNGVGTSVDRLPAGGAIAGKNCSLTLSKVVIRNNSIAGHGGGICVLSATSFSLLDSVVTENQATKSGGGITASGGAIVLKNTTISDNSGATGSGGINIHQSTINIEGCRVTGNTANVIGGGMNLQEVNGTVSDTEISGNVVEGFGGHTSGLFAFYSKIVFTRITVTDNETPTATSDNGEGSMTLVTCKSQVIDSLIAGNRGASGIGFPSWGSSLLGPEHIINTTIANNIADARSVRGGGVYNGRDQVFITNSTITGNTATSNGGGIYEGVNGVTHVRNTIVAGNTSPSGPDLHGTSFVSQGYNLIGNTGGSTAFGVTGDQLNINPMLDPNGLQDNGGPTLTIALQPGSPAIDKGHSSGSRTDQRGEVRPFDFTEIANATEGDGADIGAFESQGVLASLSLTSITKTGTSVQLQGLGGPNVVYDIQAADDLALGFDPFPIGTATAGADGSFTFTDITDLPRRFYRAVLP